MSIIREVHAFEILDSRGNPTLQVNVVLANGTLGWAQVPSGASTGKHEALELRDGDPARYGGKGVLQAVRNVNEAIAAAVLGMAAADQESLDNRLIELDGTIDKSNLGANAILGVSCAVARAAAAAEGIPLWSYLSGGRRVQVPLPMINILSGGHHAGHNFEIQDFLAVPHGFPTFAQALEAAAAVRTAALKVLEGRGVKMAGVADEGGWGPLLPSNEEALSVMVQAIERAGYVPGQQVSIAIDVAATHFYRDDCYELASEHRALHAPQMVDLLESWTRKYPVLSIEDGLAEDDWLGMKALTDRLGDRVQLVGDDFFTTCPERVLKGISEGACNSVLVKMNQIGTLTETFEVLDIAYSANYTAVVSARSGETEDSFLADLAVASGAGQIKVGSVARSERLAKYNRLLELETLGACPYAGSGPLARFLSPA